MDFGIDVESAKQKYLSQWQHCPGKCVTAVDSALVCDCKARFDWKRALGEDVALAIERQWLSLVTDTSTLTDAQPSLF